MIVPDMMCMGCPHSDGHNYTQCFGNMQGTTFCLNHRFSNINDRSFGKERKHLFQKYKQNPY